MPRKTKVTRKKTASLAVSPKMPETRESKKINLKKSPLGILILVIVFFLLGSLLYSNKKLIVAGTVNGTPITSFEIYNRLVSQSGKQLFDQIVVERLVMQEAAKQNITVSEKEIDDEVKKVEESLGDSLSLEDALTQQGLTLNDFRQQIKLRLLAVKLVEKKVEITDQQVADYMNQNKDSLPESTDPEEQKQQIKDFLREQKINEEIQNLVQELKNSAHVVSYL